MTVRHSNRWERRWNSRARYRGLDRLFSVDSTAVVRRNEWLPNLVGSSRSIGGANNNPAIGEQRARGYHPLSQDPIHIRLAEVRKVAPVDRENRPNVVGEIGHLRQRQPVPKCRHRPIALRQGHPQRFDTVGDDFDQIDAA